MTREEVTKHIRESPKSNFLLILPTGHGKTFQALQLLKTKVIINTPVLIVVPRLVLIENWKKEFKKFNMEEHLKHVIFTTYNSLHKHTNTNYVYTIYDECHHLSDRCKEIIPNIKSVLNIFLSATVKQDLKQWIINNYNPEIIEVNLRNAIENEVLPEPKVYLMPLQLNNTFFTETLI